MTGIRECKNGGVRRSGWLPHTVSQIRRYRRYWGVDLVIAAVLILASVLVSLGPTDLRLARLFYDASQPTAPWPLGRSAPWNWLYEISTLIAVAIPLGCVVRLIGGHADPRRRQRVCLYLLLALLLGSGLAVNGVFKLNWGRQRPRHVVEFGGRSPYQSAFERGVRGRGKSFPCGHSSVGYYLTAFYFVFRRRPRMARTAFAVAMVLGTAIGLSRMTAGAHFASDVAWSAAMVFLVNLVLYYFLMNVPAWEDGIAAPLTIGGRRWPFMVGVGVLIAATLFGVAAASPIHEDLYFETSHLYRATGQGVLRIRAEECDVELRLARERIFRVEGEAFGFGFPGSVYDAGMTCGETEGRPSVEFHCGPRGWFSEVDAHARITVPLESLSSVEIDLCGALARVAPGSTLPGDVVLRVDNGILLLPKSWQGAAIHIEGNGRAEYASPEP